MIEASPIWPHPCKVNWIPGGNQLPRLSDLPEAPEPSSPAPLAATLQLQLQLSLGFSFCDVVVKFSAHLSLRGSRNRTWQQPVIHEPCSPKLGDFGVPTITAGTRKATWHWLDHILLAQHAGCSIISGPQCLCFQLHPWLQQGYKPAGHSKHHSSFWKGFWELLPHSQEPPHHQTPATHRDFSFHRRKMKQGLSLKA